MIIRDSLIKDKEQPCEESVLSVGVIPEEKFESFEGPIKDKDINEKDDGKRPLITPIIGGYHFIVYVTRGFSR